MRRLKMKNAEIIVHLNHPDMIKEIGLKRNLLMTPLHGIRMEIAQL